MIRRVVVAVALAVALMSAASAQPPGRRADSPAASQIPQAQTTQEFSDELIAAGRVSFGAQCGFCHGRETTGGAGGSDLTRSELVAQDVRGDRIATVVRSGRPDAGMPAFAGIAEDELNGIVAFIHSQRALAATLEGGRRSVTADDLQSGDAAAGRR